jgi:hypothetical protein
MHIQSVRRFITPNMPLITLGKRLSLLLEELEMRNAGRMYVSQVGRPSGSLSSEAIIYGKRRPFKSTRALMRDIAKVDWTPQKKN